MVTDNANLKQDDLPFTQVRLNDFIWYVRHLVKNVFSLKTKDVKENRYPETALISFDFNSEVLFTTQLKRNKPFWPNDTLVIQDLKIQKTNALQLKQFALGLSQIAKFHGYDRIGIIVTDSRLREILTEIGFNVLDHEAYILDLHRNFKIKDWI